MLSLPTKRSKPPQKRWVSLGPSPGTTPKQTLFDMSRSCRAPTRLLRGSGSGILNLRASRATGRWGATFWRIIQVISWALIIGLCLYILYLIFRSTWTSSPVRPRAEPQIAEEEIDIKRLEQLPFDIRAKQQGLLERAQAKYESGNYGEAIVLLFSYQLLQLDKYNLIRLVKGKTNRQYLRELRPHTEIQSLLQPTMISFEDFFFGGHTLSKERFEQSWQHVNRFHQLVRPTQSTS